MVKRDKIKKTKNYGIGEVLGGTKKKRRCNLYIQRKISNFYTGIFKCCTERESSSYSEIIRSDKVFYKNIYQRR